MKINRKTNEIDFYAVNNNKKFYLQVCNELSTADVRKREEKPFHFINDNIRRVIVVNRPIDEIVDDKGITVIGIADFLLRYIK